MFMVLSSWQSHCESTPGSFDECRMAPSGRRPKTKPDDLGCESACTGCQKLHPPSPFIIAQPESWYSFYRPTEGRRLSRPSLLDYNTRSGRFYVWNHWEIMCKNIMYFPHRGCLRTLRKLYVYATLTVAVWQTGALKHRAARTQLQPTENKSSFWRQILTASWP